MEIKTFSWARAFAILRAAGLGTWALASVAFLIGSAFHFRAYGQERDPVMNEHRVTVLETGYDRLAADLSELKKLMYWAIFGTSGLAVEAGVRAVSGGVVGTRRRRREED